MTEPITQAAPDFDFSHLEVKNKTERFPLPWVSPGAALFIRVAGESNKQYNSAMLKMSSRRQRDIASKGALSPEDARKDREEDLILYPKHVVEGWEGIKNTAGEDVEFSRANCKVLLSKLPAWVFDRLRIFAMKPENFIDDVDELDGDAEGLAEN